MQNIVNKIKAYAKANGVETVDFLSDVVLEKPSDADIKIAEWNLDISKPTFEQLNALETEAAAIETDEANAKQAQIDLKASAKAKLVAGEKLTEEEANVLVGV
jgi:hypothetical protein